MNLSRQLTLAAGALICLAAGGSAHALEDTDGIVYTAGGACQSNNTAVNDVRARVGGIINVGAPSIYVICSTGTEWNTAASYDAVSDFHVRVSNTSGATKNIQCTLQPGYTNTTVGSTTHQGAFPKQVNLPANSSAYISWYRADVVGNESTDEISSPNVICLLPQGTMVHYLNYFVAENIGL